MKAEGKPVRSKTKHFSAIFYLPLSPLRSQRCFFVVSPRNSCEFDWRRGFVRLILQTRAVRLFFLFLTEQSRISAEVEHVVLLGVSSVRFSR